MSNNTWIIFYFYVYHYSNQYCSLQPMPIIIMFRCYTLIATCGIHAGFSSFQMWMNAIWPPTIATPTLPAPTLSAHTRVVVTWVSREMEQLAQVCMGGSRESVREVSTLTPFFMIFLQIGGYFWGLIPLPFPGLDPPLFCSDTLFFKKLDQPMVWWIFLDHTSHTPLHFVFCICDL